MGREHRSIAKRRYRSWRLARQGLVDHLDLASLDTAKGAEQLAARINDVFDQFDVDRSAGIDASKASAFMTGDVISVDGGYTLI